MRPKRRDRAASREAGYSLIELAVVISIIVAVIGGTGATFATFQQAFIEGTTIANTDELSRRVRDRILEEMLFADRVSILVAADGRSISYQPVTGWDGAAPILGPEETIVFDPAVRSVAVNGVVIAQGVDDLVFQRVVDTVTVTVQIDAELERQRGTVTRRLVTEWRP